MQIGPELRPVGEMTKRKTRKGEQKSQNRDISPHGGTTCEPIFNQIWYICSSYHRRYYVYQKWFEKLRWFSQGDMWKNACVLIESQGLYNIAMRHRAGL